MAGYPSNLAKTFSPTEQFPQHILPLPLLYNAQWWGYESVTAIVLVCSRNFSNAFCTPLYLSMSIHIILSFKSNDD